MYRHSLNDDFDTFAYDVKRAAQLLLYIPETNVIYTLGRSMPLDTAFLITRAARIFLADELARVSRGRA